MKTNHCHKFSLKARLTSIRYACEGVMSFFKTQHNAFIHLFFTIIVVIAAVGLKISATEATVLALAIGFVWAAEIFNTAIEKLADHLAPEQHPKIKFVKDVAAAAVLVSAITAILVGAIIFIPKF